MIIRHVPTVVPAEGVILERVLDATYPVWNGGLGRQAYGKLDAAQMKTAWGRHHQGRFALVDGAHVLASAAQYALAAILDQRPVRVCGIGSIFSELAHRSGGYAQELVDRRLDQAARDGAVVGVLFSEGRQELLELNDFEVPRRDDSVTARSASALGTIVGGTWTIEECGDRDPSGARVGAILQALIARVTRRAPPDDPRLAPSRVRTATRDDRVGEAVDGRGDGPVTRIVDDPVAAV